MEEDMFFPLPQSPTIDVVSSVTPRLDMHSIWMQKQGSYIPFATEETTANKSCSGLYPTMIMFELYLNLTVSELAVHELI